MACASCSTGAPGGCQNHGSCATGSCNKLNTHDWLSSYEYEDPTGTDLIEVSFKNGARKEFYRNHSSSPAISRQMVVVDTGTGYDIGEVSLTGELVRIQMKKKGVKENAAVYPVIRIANERDIEKLGEYRKLEDAAMVRARAIAVSSGLDMKVCDVEYRGDGKKVTFYYTADGRVDFRELVRLYAKEFQVKIEMRQIGARQESARIGGIGSCGRELCCSTWLTDFKSVNTHAARYQNLSINQAKLSGQCGRLKCCLNYELDTYMDALDSFPKNVDSLQYQGGYASLIKIDIFKQLLYYSMLIEKGKTTIVALHVDRVKWIKALNQKGQLPDQLVDPADIEEKEKMDFADVTGDIELPDPKRKKKKKSKKPQRDRKPLGNEQNVSGQESQNKQSSGNQTGPKENRRHGNRPRQENRQQGEGQANQSNNRQRNDRNQQNRRDKRPDSPAGQSDNSAPDPKNQPQDQNPKPKENKPGQDRDDKGQSGPKNPFRFKNKKPRGPKPPQSN